MKNNEKIVLFLSIVAATCATADSSTGLEIGTPLEKVVDKVVDVINLGIDFLKHVASLTADNSARFSTIRNTMEELQLDPKSSELTTNEAEIVVALHQASDSYLKMFRLINELCFYNDATFEDMESSSDLEDGDNFYAEAKTLLEEQAFDLTAMVKKTLEKKLAAYKYIDEVREKISSISGTLTKTTESFRILRNAKAGGLQNDIESANARLAESCSWFQFICKWNKKANDAQNSANKASAEAMLVRVEKFFEDSTNYVKWLEKTGAELKNETKADEDILTELAGKAEHGQTLLEKLREMYLPDLKEKSRKKIRSFSNKLYSAARNITETCHRFMDRNKNKNRRSIIEHKSSDRDQLYACAFGSTEHMSSRQTYFEINSKINSSLPHLDAQTFKKLVAVSTYFKISQENIRNIIFRVKTNVVRFLNRQKIIHDTVADLTGQHHETGSYSDLLAQITHLDSYWGDNLSKLQKLKDEWGSYLNTINGSEPENIINYEVNKKTKQIIFLLDSFKIGMVQKVPYGDGKTTDLSTLALSTLTYLGEILRDNFTAPVSLKTEDRSLNVSDQVVAVGENENIGKRPCLLKTNGKHYQDLVSQKYSEIQTSLQSLTDVPTRNKLFALTVFHELSLKSLGHLGSLLKISTDYFLFELKKLDKFLMISTLEETKDREYYETSNYLEQLTALWENVIFNLRTHSYDRHRFLSKIQDNKTTTTTLQNTVDYKITAIRNILDDKNLSKVSHVRGYILTWSLVSYLEKIL